MSTSTTPASNRPVPSWVLEGKQAPWVQQKPKKEEKKIGKLAPEALAFLATHASFQHPVAANKPEPGQLDIPVAVETLMPQQEKRQIGKLQIPEGLRAKGPWVKRDVASAAVPKEADAKQPEPGSLAAAVQEFEENYKKTHDDKEYEWTNFGKRESSWFAAASVFDPASERVMISFDQATGWKIEAIGKWDRITRKVAGCLGETHMPVIAKELARGNAQQTIPKQIKNHLEALLNKYNAKYHEQLKLGHAKPEVVFDDAGLEKFQGLSPKTIEGQMLVVEAINRLHQAKTLAATEQK